MIDLPLEEKIILYACIILFFAVVYFAGGGSKTIGKYLPQGKPTSGTGEEEEELIDIKYNDEFLKELSGGYAGAPRLVASDDKVFYIPPEYCDGDYLRNFRVIGINQSRAEEKAIPDGDGTVMEYSGAVVVYGFQTTYRTDYGSDYNFNNDPYGITMEYDTSNSYFENLMNDISENLNSDGVTPINDYDEKYAEDKIEDFDNPQIEADVDPENIKTEDNPAAVDDSEFRVATVVMEHEIGKDYCKILYCDADSCKVKDLGAGDYNLVTNMNDSALTVCYNQYMYVYNFDENDRSYASKERYSYSLREFFESSTYRNTMQGAGYASSTYDVEMDIEYSDCSDGWVNNYLKNMNRHLTFTLDQKSNLYTYFSNIVGDTISTEEIRKNIIDTRAKVEEQVLLAYNGYKKTSSGMLSIKNLSYVDAAKFNPFHFVTKSSNIAWVLENDFTYNISERSWLILFPKTYNGEAKGKVRLTIVPHFDLNPQYEYTINDLILNQSKTVNKDGTEKINYAIVMQMLITPTSADEDTPAEGFEENELKNFASKYPSKLSSAYAGGSRKMNVADFVGDEEVPEEDDEEYEDIEEEDIDEKELEEEFEEDLKGQIQEYLTFNIDLSNEIGSVEKEDSIYSITGANEAKAQFDDAKKLYNREYNDNLKSYAKTTKSGPYAEATNVNAEGFERLKEDFRKICDKQYEIDAAREQLALLEEQLESIGNIYSENADVINQTVEDILGSENVNRNKNEMLYYESVQSLLDPESEKFNLVREDLIKNFSSFLANQEKYEYECGSGSGIPKGFYVFSDPTTIGASKFMRGSGNLLDDNMITTDNERSRFDARRIMGRKGYVFRVYKIVADNGRFVPSDSYDEYNLSNARCTVNDFESALNEYYNFDLARLDAGSSDENERQQAYSDMADILNRLKFAYEYARCVYRYDLDRYYYDETFLKPLFSWENVYNLDETFSALKADYDSMFTAEPDYSTEVTLENNNKSSVSTYDYTKYDGDLFRRFIDYYEFAGDILASGNEYSVEIKKTDNSSENVSFYGAILGNIDVREDYDLVAASVSEQEAKLQRLQAELTELERAFDSSHYYVQLKWKGRVMNGAALAENYKNYNTITAEIDKYIDACGILDEVKEFRGDSDKFIQYINEVNGAVRDSDVYSYIDHGFDEITFRDSYGEDACRSYMYLADKGDRLFADTVLGAYIERQTAKPAEEENPTDYNTQLINNAVEQRYGKTGKNAAAKRSYDLYMEDCETIYKNLYDDFRKTTVTDEEGNETPVCDITSETVQNAVFTYLIDKFGIYELYNYDSKGEIEGTYSIAKSEQSGGVMEEVIEASRETVTEPEYANSFDAITSDFSGLASYTLNADGCYKNILGIANAFLRGTGCLSDEQKQVNTPEESGAESDVTSLYYRGYQVPAERIGDMLVLLDNINKLCNERERAANVIRGTQQGGLEVILKTDDYYLDLYRKKCAQADDLYRLMYNVARSGNTEKQKYLDEFESKEWLILDDVNITDDLSSVIKVETRKITTYYKNIVWNTALITDDKRSNISPEPYELYQMNNDFCVGVADNNGFIIPIGAQKDLDVRSLNANIKSRIGDIGGVTTVAYGSEGNVDYILFANKEQWARFAITTKGKSVDVGNISCYTGDFDCDTGDPHFMEFDRTRITGVNQLYMSSLDNGYIPYDIILKGNGNSTIKSVDDPFAWENDEDVVLSSSKGIRGAYFKSWSDAKGNVVLLGFSEDDMRIEETTTDGGGSDTAQNAGGTGGSDAGGAAGGDADAGAEGEDGESEPTSEARREITDADIYNAHLYVYKYATKKAEIPEKYDDPMSNWVGPDIHLFDAGIELEGPYGRLLQPAVNFFTVIRSTILLLIYALAMLYAVYLGVKLARASDDEKRNEAKEHIKWFILAFFIAHILIAFLYLAQQQLSAWEESVVTYEEYNEETK